MHVWHWMDVQFERIATETLNGFACCCCGTVCVVVLCLDSGLCEQTTKVVGTGHASKRANIRELEQRCGGEAGSGTMVSDRGPGTGRLGQRSFEIAPMFLCLTNQFWIS